MGLYINHSNTPSNQPSLFLKNILIPNVAEKNILILVEEKKLI
jgi:hypothetical protein